MENENDNQSAGTGNEFVQPTVNALDRLGLDQSEIRIHRSDLKRKEYDRLVCVCGHAVNKHKEFRSGTWQCHTARMYCPCEWPKAVVEVSDTRYFMTKSRGYGARHALSTGLSRLHERGGTSRVVIEPLCFACKRETTPLLPATFDSQQRLIFKPGPLNGLFCHDCLSEFTIDHFSK
jgi:hypothetical protein